MQTPHPTSFYVSKWYADVIDQRTGNLAIFYSGKLRWGSLHLHFANLLQFTDRQTLHTVASWKKTQVPTLQDQKLAITHPFATATWENKGKAVQAILFENEKGYILWECLLPQSQVALKTPQTDFQYLGWGYAERLTFTLKPWEMPIKILHWGRWVTEKFVIVWIKWEGDAPKNLLFFNGEPVENAIIDENQLIFEDYRVDLSQKSTLRNGSVMSTVFKKFTWLKKIFPNGLLNLYEQKWQTLAKLLHQDKLVEETYIIHEKVEWI